MPGLDPNEHYRTRECQKRALAADVSGPDVAAIHHITAEKIAAMANVANPPLAA